MFLKAFASLGLLTTGSLYAFGAFDAFPATVDGSPEKVMAELADLHVREQPGEPGTSAEAAGGVTPRFIAMQGENLLEWRVMAGNQIAMRLVATFEPIDGGIRTRITPYVERGDAPDAYTPPAFRSTGLASGLFQAALQAEINEMNAPGWGPHCDKLRDEMLYAPGPEMNSDLALRQGSDGSGSDAERFAIGMQSGIGNIRKVQQMHRRLMEAGCNPDKAPGANGGEFREVTDRLGPVSSSAEGHEDSDWGVSR